MARGDVNIQDGSKAVHTPIMHSPGKFGLHLDDGAVRRGRSNVEVHVRVNFADGIFDGVFVSSGDSGRFNHGLNFLNGLYIGSLSCGSAGIHDF